VSVLQSTRQPEEDEIQLRHSEIGIEGDPRDDAWTDTVYADTVLRVLALSVPSWGLRLRDRGENFGMLLTSIASDLVIEMTAALEAQYGANPPHQPHYVPHV
jgi:hypothetical protein